MASRLPSRDAVMQLGFGVPIHLAARSDLDTLALGYVDTRGVFVASNTREVATGGWSATSYVRPWTGTGRGPA